MSIASWIGVGQLTFVLVTTWFAARLWLSRQPQIAAKVCLVGLVMSTTLAILLVFSVPRPLIYRADLLDEVSAIGVTNENAIDSSNTRASTHVAAKNQAPSSSVDGFGFRVRGAQFLQSLRSLSRHSHEHVSLVRAIGVCISIGVVIQVCFVAFGTWELIQLRSGATQITCANTIAKLNQLCKQAGVLDPPQLRVHQFSLGAFVSWLDPRVIYLPASYTEWTTEELSAAIAHELMHVSRRDGMWRYVSRVCAGVLWFHPGAWILHRELCLAQELSADRTARSLMPGSGYLVGLAKLGLRLDREDDCRMPKLSVSIFTKDLIRRIEMLKRTQGTTSTASLGLARATLAAVLSVCVTSFCWTVDADEEIRIASRVVDTSTPSQQTAFQKPRLEPWQVVPAAKGYGAIRVSSMSENAYLASLISLADEFILSQNSSALDASMIDAIQSHGVKLQNVDAVQMGVDLTQSSTTTADDSGTTKEKHYMSVGSHQVVVDTIAPVNWRAVVDLLPVERMTEMLNESAGPIEQSKLQEMLDGLASLPSESKRFSLHTEPNCGDAVDSTLAGVWRAVDGGIATFVVDYKASFNADEAGTDDVPPSGAFSMVSESTHEATDAPISNVSIEAELEQAKLSKMISYIGLGVDLAPNSNELTFRIVCTPTEDAKVDELEAQWTRFATAALKAFESDNGTGDPAENEYSMKVMTQLLAMQCVQTSDVDSNPTGIILTGSLPLP